MSIIDINVRPRLDEDYSNHDRMLAFIELLAARLEAEGHGADPELMIELLMQASEETLADCPPGSERRLRELVTEGVHAILHQRASLQHSTKVH